MENKAEAPAAAAAAMQENNKEAAPAPAPAASCFKKATVAEDATLVDLAKEQFRQFKEAPMEEHWSCIKNKVLSVFGETPTNIFGGLGAGKDNNKAAPPSVESQ